MAYEVTIDGQTRQAHVDHLKPNPQPVLAEPECDVAPTQDKDSANDQSLTDQAIDDSSSVILHPFMFVDNDETNAEQENMEVNSRPQRHRKPTRHLILT